MKTQAVKGLSTKQAFAQMISHPSCDITNRNVLKHRMKKGMLTLDKMIELLNSNGYNSIQDQIWVKRT